MFQWLPILTQRCKAAELVCTALICGALLSCESRGKDDNETNSREAPQILPDQFEDVFDKSWTCNQSPPDLPGTLTGELHFPSGSPISRADILHISFFEMSDSDVQLIAIKCVNNILLYNFDFTLDYDSNLIQEDKRYLLATRFFKRQEDGRYQLTFEPDGLVEVVNNNLTTDIQIHLEPL